VVVGIVSSGQNQMGQDGLVGHCANFLPLRLTGAPTYAATLQATRRVLFDAFDHQNFTFGELVKTLRVDRSLARLPLVSVAFNLDPKPQPLAFGSIQTLDRGVAKRRVNLDIHLNAVETASGLRLDCAYLAALFDAGTIRRWLNYFRVILEAMARDLETDVDAIDPIGDDEREDLLRRWNDTSRPDSRTTVHRLIEAQAQRSPDKVAVRSAGLTLTYRQLMQRADAVASALRARNVGRGQTVGLAVSRSADMVAGLLGILRAGAAYVPIDPTHPADRRTYVVRDAGAAVLLSEPSVVTGWPVPCPVLHLADALGHPASSRPDDTTPDDLAYVLYTSGSTGNPKGVEVEHRALVNLLESMQRQPGLGSADVLLAVTTLSFDIATLEVFLPLIAGGTVVVAPAEAAADPGLIAESLTANAVTVMQATPVTWRLLVESGWKGHAGLKALVGGEAFPPDLAAALLARCGEVWNMYGPTETTIWSTCRQIHNARVDIGQPIANTDVYVLDDRLRLVPTGVIGEIMIGGLGLARGYRNQPDLTAARFVPHPFRAGDRLYRTGDRGRWLADGSLVCLGRLDHQIKIRGFRVEPGEIEAALQTHPAVAHAVVVSRQDVPGDPQLVAYYERTVETAAQAADLREHLRARVPAYMVPASFVALDALPQTANGKIDRKALPRPETAAKTAVVAAERNPSPLEESLARIWGTVLGADRVGLDDNFFDLGGHSLLAIRLALRVRDELGDEMPFSLLLQNPTVATLAQAIEKLRAPRAQAGDSPLVLLHAGSGHPPIFFVHTVGGEVWSYKALAQHLGEDQPVYGLQAHSLIGDRPISLEELARQYVGEIRRVQPRGPYMLAGHCAGAALALEMARQLHAAGLRVELLAVLDYAFADTRDPRWSRRLPGIIRNVPYWVADDLARADLTTVAGRLGSHWRKLRSAVARTLSGRSNDPTDIRDTLGMWRFPTYQVRMIERLFAAVQAYRPAPYPGDVLLIRPRAMPLLRSQPQDDLGWRRIVTGRLQVEVVKGSHETMMSEPLVADVARRLRAAISRVHGFTTVGQH
jgi:amino acid adenylation domain-containing protein